MRDLALLPEAGPCRGLSFVKLRPDSLQRGQWCTPPEGVDSHCA